jgi:hypothetical protein
MMMMMMMMMMFWANEQLLFDHRREAERSSAVDSTLAERIHRQEACQQLDLTISTWDDAT